MMKNDQKFIESIAQMYLNGMSLRNIAAEVGLSHITVRKLLLEDLYYYNVGLYEDVYNMMQSNKPKTINDKEVVDRIVRSYYHLIKDNMTIEEIASEEKVGSFVIYRDLTTRLFRLNKIMPDIVTNEMVKNVGEILKKHSMDNLVNQVKK